MFVSKRWLYFVGVAFLVGLSVYPLGRYLDKRQRIKTVERFALALQGGDYATVALLALPIEQTQLNVTPKTVQQAFERLRLPSLQFVGIVSDLPDPLRSFVKTRWRTAEGKEYELFVEVMREGIRKGKWCVNFFFTFRRFCALKLVMGGKDRREAFMQGSEWAKWILASVGIIGYVTDLGTVRSFGGELLGIVRN